MANFPGAMRAVDAWVVWLDKSAPVSPVTGQQKNWNKFPGSFARAEDFLNKNQNYRFGFLFEAAPGFFGLDLDGCRDPETGIVETWAQEIIDDLGSYAEVSQSGTGVKIIARSESKRVGPRVYFPAGAKAIGDHVPQVEIFQGAKYFALTGENFTPDYLKTIDLARWSSDFQQRADLIGDFTYKADAPPAVDRNGPTSNYHEIFNQETSIAGLLTSHGWAQLSDHEFKRPGKETKGVSATTRVDDRGVERLSVWSTSVPELPANDAGGRVATYDAWSVFARLEFDGDFGRAKSDYLTRRPELSPRATPADDFEPAADHNVVEGESIDRFLISPPESIDDLGTDPPVLSPVVVDGLFREGEIVNLIAASKVGKTILAHDLAYSVAMGSKWLGSFDVPNPGPVLILDNELHRNTLRWRLWQVGLKRGLEFGKHRPPVRFKSLRGRIPNIFKLSVLFNQINPGDYKLIILDSLYRFFPPKMNENDNNAMTEIYNTLDGYAGRLRAAFALIHHTSKGIQSEKSTVDVGSGAGAMARAADCHLVIRNHQDDGLHVLDFESRSFLPVDSLTIERDGLAWVRSDVPAILRSTVGKRDATKDENDNKLIVEYLSINGPTTLNGIYTNSKASSGKTKIEKLIKSLVDAGRLKGEEVKGKKGVFYSVVVAEDFI